ncbi:MAG: hypothetical protein RIF33_03840 [Cyclobacteriaceae bacterium]
MKKHITILLLLVTSYGWCQTYKTKFEESLAAQGINTVIISNVYGAVDIQGTKGDQIDVSADVLMRGNDDKQLEKLKNGVTLGMERLSDTLLIYSKVAWLCDRYLCKKNCHFHWNSDEDGEFLFDFAVSLPKGLNVEAATVNDGDINIFDISGRVSVDNVNGSINLHGVSNVVKARTINGELTAQFDKAPTVPGSFYALNGDITSEFPNDLSADIGFKSFNGEFFTDFAFAQSDKTSELKVSESGSGTKYKLEEKSGISVGGGGVALKFETLNGDMYVKRK